MIPFWENEYDNLSNKLISRMQKYWLFCDSQALRLIMVMDQDKRVMKSQKPVKLKNFYFAKKYFSFFLPSFS